MEKAPESILRHWDVWVDFSSAAVGIHHMNFPGRGQALNQKVPPVLMPPSLKIYSLENADQLPIVDAATDGAGSGS